MRREGRLSVMVPDKEKDKGGPCEEDDWRTCVRIVLSAARNVPAIVRKKPQYVK
jgi:hypothetical protein